VGRGVLGWGRNLDGSKGTERIGEIVLQTAIHQITKERKPTNKQIKINKQNENKKKTNEHQT